MRRNCLVLICVSLSLWKRGYGALCGTGDFFGENNPASKDNTIDSNTGQIIVYNVAGKGIFGISEEVKFLISNRVRDANEKELRTLPGSYELYEENKRYFDRFYETQISTRYGYIMSEANYIIDCCGVVEKWEAFFDNVGASTRSVYFQIWRPTSGDAYELVGENLFSVSSDGEQSKTIATSDRITVKSGDKFGWWNSGADIIKYKSGGGEEDDNWFMSLADLNVGDTQDWSSRTTQNDRSYAIRVDMEPNNVPSFTNLPGSTSILNSDSSGNTLITIAVDDADTDDISTLSVTMTANSQFSFDTSTLILTTGTITSSGSTEILVFEVSDQCGNTATASYTVTITNTPPVINSVPSSDSISEDATTKTLLHTIVVTDTEAVTCSMASSVPGSYPFTVELVSGSSDYGIYSSSSPGFSYSTQSSYALTIDCTDGANTVSGSYTVYLLQNTPPVIVNLQNSTSVSTTTTIGSTVFTVLATDAEGDSLSYTMTCTPSSCPFSILDSGAIQTTQDLTLHTTVGYDLSITVADARATVGPSTLTITITDINDPVAISNLPLSSAMSVSENTALATSVFTVSYSDLDTTQTHTFSMTSSPGEGSSYFSIDPSTGVVSTAGSTLNYETLTSMTFTFSVTVTDTVASDSQDLVINIVNVNEAPVFSPTSYSLTTTEGAAGTSIGTPSFGVTDPDASDTKAYTMDCSTYSGYFNLNTSSGEVTYQTDYDFDAATLPSVVTCTVTVTDSGGLTDTATLTININDLNDNTPVFLPTTYTFYMSYYSSVGAAVGTTTATDADSGAFGTFTYTLNQATLGAAYFAIDSTGLVSLAQSPTGSSVLNYSSSAEFIAIATDSGGLSSTATVTIVVSDTTTVSTTVQTVTYMTFFDDPHNWAWFIPCMLALFAALVVTCWVVMTCKGEKGCEAVIKKLFKKRGFKPRKPPGRSFHRQSNNRARALQYEQSKLDETISVRRPPPSAGQQPWRRDGYLS